MDAGDGTARTPAGGGTIYLRAAEIRPVAASRSNIR
jgi:hypothetical protein